MESLNTTARRFPTCRNTTRFRIPRTRASNKWRGGSRSTSSGSRRRCRRTAERIRADCAVRRLSRRSTANPRSTCPGCRCRILHRHGRRNRRRRHCRKARSSHRRLPMPMVQRLPMHRWRQLHLREPSGRPRHGYCDDRGCWLLFIGASAAVTHTAPRWAQSRADFSHISLFRCSLNSPASSALATVCDPGEHPPCDSVFPNRRRGGGGELGGEGRPSRLVHGPVHELPE
jgi:hypothetical protein